MNYDNIVAIVVAVLSSRIIEFFFTRYDNKKGMMAKLDKIISEQKKSEKDALRTQLLVMMYLLPNNQEEIMSLAQRYFGELKGDWFYSSLFNKWLKDNQIDKPIWFDETK